MALFHSTTPFGPSAMRCLRRSFRAWGIAAASARGLAPALARALLGTLLLLGAPAQSASACADSTVTWMRIAPTTFFFTGTDRCGGQQPPAIAFDDQMVELPIDGSGLFDGSLTIPETAREIAIRFSDGSRKPLFSQPALGALGTPPTPSVIEPRAIEPRAAASNRDSSRQPAGDSPSLATLLGPTEAQIADQMAALSIPFTGEDASNAPLPTAPLLLDVNQAFTVNGRTFDQEAVAGADHSAIALTGTVSGLARLTAPEQTESTPRGSSVSQPLFGGSRSSFANAQQQVTRSTPPFTPTLPTAPGVGSQQESLALAEAAPLVIDPDNALWTLVNRRAYAERAESAASAAGNPPATTSATSDDNGRSGRGGFLGWLLGNDDQPQQASASPSTAARARVYPSDQDYFTIELIWNAPVDLDLHVFEPTAAGPRVANSNAPGHVWTKASGALRKLAKGSLYELEQLPRDAVNREVYILPYSTLGALGDYDIQIDYLTRRQADSSQEQLCGNGAYASIPTVVRIRTPQINREQRLTLSALPCDDRTARNELISVGTVNLY